MNVLELFAGIGGMSLGLERAGIPTAAAVEVDDAARAVYAHHFPDTPLFTDVREVTGDQLRAAGFVPERGILAGGFPCQDLSVAGRRAGMGRGSGTRSALFWEIDRLVGELGPRWVVLENVPGLLSQNGGRDMGAVLGALAERGYGFAYRVLDAQHFGVPQRRRRVFIVAGAGGDAAGPAQVLLEPESGGRDPAPSRTVRPGTTGGTVVSTLNAGSDGRGWRVGADEAAAGHLVAAYAKARRAGEHDDSPESWQESGTAPTVDAIGHGRRTATAVVSLAVAGDYSTGEDVAQTVRGANGQPGTVAVPIAMRGRDEGAEIEAGQDGDPAFALRTPAGGSSHPMVATTAVRRLTPRECERLQGFPDDWTAGQSDSARYRQLGNAVAVPVAEWVARRVAAHEQRRAAA